MSQSFPQAFAPGTVRRPRARSGVRRKVVAVAISLIRFPGTDENDCRTLAGVVYPAD